MSEAYKIEPFTLQESVEILTDWCREDTKRRQFTLIVTGSPESRGIASYRAYASQDLDEGTNFSFFQTFWGCSVEDVLRSLANKIKNLP